MGGVPHHLLGCVDLEEDPWTISRFVSESKDIIEDVHSRGKLPIIVGGTHYYVQSLLLVNNIVASESKVSSNNDTEREWPILATSSEKMLEKLRQIDPEAAEWWHPRDARKIRRSLEICLESGRRVSDIYREQQQENSSDGPAQHERYDSLCLHLHAERDILVERLDRRVDQMMERGLLDEVCFMHDEHLRLQRDGKHTDETKGIWVAIGYKEFAEYIARNRKESNAAELAKLKAESCERTKIATRQYASRQGRWVENKLIPALRNANCLERFFALDATNLNAWDDEVTQPAILLASSFLEQSPLPDPSLIGVTANLLAQTNKATRVKNTCEVCQVTTVTAMTWEQHLKSAKHKKLTRPRKDHRSAANNEKT